VIRVPEWNGALEVTGAHPHTAIQTAPGEWRIDLTKGETVLIHPQGRQVTPVIRPIPLKDSERNLYGVKKGEQLKQFQAWPEPPVTVE